MPSMPRNGSRRWRLTSFRLLAIGRSQTSKRGKSLNCWRRLVCQGRDGQTRASTHGYGGCLQVRNSAWLPPAGLTMCGREGRAWHASIRPTPARFAASNACWATLTSFGTSREMMRTTELPSNRRERVEGLSKSAGRTSMPVASNFARACGTRVPSRTVAAAARLMSSATTRRRVSARTCHRQHDRLLSNRYPFGSCFRMRTRMT